MQELRSTILGASQAPIWLIASDNISQNYDWIISDESTLQMSDLRCLTAGQRLVIVNKVFEHMGPIQFLQKVPNRYFTSLLMENFYELASSVFGDSAKHELDENFWESTFTGLNEPFSDLHFFTGQDLCV